MAIDVASACSADGPTRYRRLNSAASGNPFASGLQHVQAPIAYRRVLDWSPGYRYGIGAVAQLEPKGVENVEILGQDGDLVNVRFNWLTMYYRYQNIDPYFGTSFYTLDVSGPQPLIKKKKVILKNDYIHHVVDIYHV